MDLTINSIPRYGAAENIKSKEPERKKIPLSSYHEREVNPPKSNYEKHKFSILSSIILGTFLGLYCVNKKRLPFINNHFPKISKK